MSAKVTLKAPKAAAAGDGSNAKALGAAVAATTLAVAATLYWALKQLPAKSLDVGTQLSRAVMLFWQMNYWKQIKLLYANLTLLQT